MWINAYTTFFGHYIDETVKLDDMHRYNECICHCLRTLPHATLPERIVNLRESIPTVSSAINKKFGMVH